MKVKVGNPKFERVKAEIKAELMPKDQPKPPKGVSMRPLSAAITKYC